MRYMLVFVTILSAATFAACSAEKPQASNLHEAWDQANSPGNFQLEIMKLADLPLEGALPDHKFPWSDYYWATYTGGLSYRWQDAPKSTNYKDFVFDVMTSKTLPADVSKLSPAEKFDLYLNRYEFPLTQFEQNRMLASVDKQTDSVPTWYGLCHGWVPASLAEPEPGEVVTVTNAAGLEIPFYSTDIKALMTFVYAFADGSGGTIGERCNTEDHEIERDEDGRVKEKSCRDVNPGTLHLALGQMLGASDPEKRQGFAIDMTHSFQVWNQPTVAYKVTRLAVKDAPSAEDSANDHRAPGTKQLADVELELFYITEISPQREPALSIRDSYTKSMKLAYTLELDENGYIIGGEWVSKDRPDFLWSFSATPSGTTLAPYEDVRRLLDASLKK